MNDSARLGRRERNKQQKLERILQAATTLFAERGVAEVTTQEIAERADIGTGTLFLYAKTKGELLLMVQNSLYAEALRAGLAAAKRTPSPDAAIMRIVRSIVECNRSHVENGRTYLREMVFGDPTEPHHATALAIVAQTSEAIHTILVESGLGAQDAEVLTGLVQAKMFLAMAASGTDVGTDDVINEIALAVNLLAASQVTPT